jgi:PadR family transcriptional regulator, regulatory protein PadR
VCSLPSARIDLPLDLLILRTLTLGAQHGWAIAEQVQQVSSDVLLIQQGSLYPALHRLEVEKDTSETLTAAVAQFLEAV